MFARSLRPAGKTLLALGALLLLGPVAAAQQAAAAKEPAPKPPAFRLTGPYTCENLTVFLIHGEDRLKGKPVLTLQEALAQKKVIVHETKNVNELAIENVSGEEVIVLSGDIVKGGHQDRTIAFDLVVPPQSGKMPLASFCVESGRWQSRGTESAVRFEQSAAQLPSKDLKKAARKAMAQGEVWKEVAKAQKKLSDNLKANVQSAQSATSLQLTLEDKKLLEAVARYTKELAPALDKKDDVLGFAFAINGEMNSAEVFASPAFFRKLWPKLLNASVVEAVAELKKDKKFAPVTADTVKAFLAAAEKGKASEKAVTKRIKEVTQETDKHLLFETRDGERHGLILRRSYLAK